MVDGSLRVQASDLKKMFQFHRIVVDTALAQEEALPRPLQPNHWIKLFSTDLCRVPGIDRPLGNRRSKLGRLGCGLHQGWWLQRGDVGDGGRIHQIWPADEQNGAPHNVSNQQMKKFAGLKVPFKRYSCSWPAYFEYYRKPKMIVSETFLIMRKLCQLFKFIANESRIMKFWRRLAICGETGWTSMTRGIR